MDEFNPNFIAQVTTLFDAAEIAQAIEAEDVMELAIEYYDDEADPEGDLQLDITFCPHELFVNGEGFAVHGSGLTEIVGRRWPIGVCPSSATR